MSQFLNRYADVLALLAVIGLACLFFWTQQPAFGRPSSIGNMINQRADLVILAVAMTFVLLVGEIDLSVGSVLALSSVVLGSVLVATGSTALAVAAALAAGTVCGALNGLLTVALRIPSFVVTLGMMEIARGLALWLSDARNVDLDGNLLWLAKASPLLTSIPGIGGLKLTPSVPIAVVIAVTAHVALRRTVFGRHAQAIGDNARAFELSGGRVGWRKVAVFAAIGLAAGLAGIMQAARLDTTDPNAGIGFELLVIAAVVVGGTSLSGGRGSVAGTLLGCLLIAVLQDGLTQIGADEFAKRICTGGVILFAVLLDAWRRRGQTG